jgi:hypothetical protein
MAKTKITVDRSQEVNARVYAAKLERRIEKSNGSASHKIKTVSKLRETAKSLGCAKLVKTGRIVSD